MTLLHMHHDDLRGFARQTPVLTPRIFRRIGIAFRLLHRAIVSAKLRRLQDEMLFQRDYSEMLAPEREVRKLPQRPLVLGDKWDF